MESEQHKQLKERAIQYIWNKNYRIARKEKMAGYYGIYDVWGITYRTYYTIGIEVKVSRADFLAAHKYKNRKLEMVNESSKFSTWGGANENYYLCPVDLIQPEETGVYGLLWFNGKRLLNKKKPAFINIGLKSKLEQLIDLLMPKPM